MTVLFALLAYLRCRWVTRAHRSRAGFLRWQDRAYRRWLRCDLPRVAFYADRAPNDLPMIDKALLMRRFGDFNRHHITADQVRAAIADDCRIGALTVGTSTGTSGNRGLFVISDAERFQWLGVMLAKALPDVWRRRHRVAVILPRHTALYDSAGQSRALTLQLHDLTAGPDHWLPRLLAQDPTVIVAPPKVLVWLADHDLPLQPRRVFSAAETLDPPDRTRIEARFGAPLGQIYMATEGLLGVTCAHGTLHLAEDVIRFELQPVGDLVSPVISGFTRREQILCRYRMNDLLRLAPMPCRCGSPLQAVAEVVGRADDLFRFGALRITPDVLRNTVLDADPEIADFRLIQHDADRLTLILPPDLAPEAADRAVAALSHRLRRLLPGPPPRIDLLRQPLLAPADHKLRRVEYRGPPDAGPDTEPLCGPTA